MRILRNRLPWGIVEWAPEGTRRKGRPNESWMDGGRWHMTHHGLTKENYRDKDIWGSLVLGARKLQYIEQIFGQMNVHSKYFISGH